MTKRLPLILIMSIPAAAVVMGMITMYLAYQGPDQEIPVGDAPLSKTSWQSSQPADELSEPTP